MTKQKRKLYEAVDNFNGFFNAYDLQDKVSTIGLATVYRFLNGLEKEGKVHSFICDGKKIYSREKKSHAHFRCEKCGEIKHISLKNVDFLDEFKGDVCHFQLEVVGTCKNCKN